MVKPFIRHASEHLLDTPIFRLRRDRAEHPETGHVGDYFVLENPDWVNVVALTPAREILLVRQWRHGTGTVELELPAGLIEPGESPLDAAARELREETGHAPARCSLLGEVAPNAAFQRNTCFTVLAEGCVPDGPTRFDAGEDIELVVEPVARLPALLRGGHFRNAMVHIGLLWWLESQGRVDWPTG
jgi:8-oxo-dGTP pyrophosphatase MutT (NUDIX family)